MNLHKKRILIIGGYGHVGSNIARLIRQNFNTAELLLAGRNPKKAESLVKEISNSKGVYLDLETDFDFKKFGPLNLIITSMEDHRNIIRELAISNGVACIHISELAEEVSTTTFHSLHKNITAPIVFAGHWQAGIMTLATHQIASKFKHIEEIQLAGLFDKRDPIGAQSADEVDGFIAKALIRINGKWKFINAKENPRTIKLSDKESIIGNPMSVLDVPSIAAFTDSKSIRFDFAQGDSFGTRNNSTASHDLYIEIKGELISGQNAELRYLISDPKGASHLTAVGAYFIAESILNSDNQSDPLPSGIQLPETMVNTQDILSRLTKFGIDVREEIE